MKTRTSRSGSIDNTPAAGPSPPATPATHSASQIVVKVNPEKKERSYSMPPIVLEKSASLSSLRKVQEDGDDSDECSGPLLSAKRKEKDDKKEKKKS